MIDKIKQQITDNLKAKNLQKVGVLRMLLSEVQYLVKSKPMFGPSDLFAMLHSSITKKQDAAKVYSEMNRPELAEKEQFEIDIYKSFLPKELDNSELNVIIDKLIETSGFSTKKQMGQLMKLVILEVAGRASNSTISKILQNKLN